MIDSKVFAGATLQEARLLLRFAASDLSPIERHAAEGFAAGCSQRSIAGKDVGFRRGAIYFAQRRALRKMKARLQGLGIYSARQVL